MNFSYKKNLYVDLNTFHFILLAHDIKSSMNSTTKYNEIIGK